MHPGVYKRFQSLIASFPPPGNRVLEIGASFDPQHALLTAFQRLSPNFECTGVNLSVPASTSLPYRMVESNANEMSMFPDASFDAVVCNAVLEHDRFFWKTLEEVRRLLVPSGLFYVGVPGFPLQHNLVQRLLIRLPTTRLRSLPGVALLSEKALLTPLASTRTFMFHAHPDDFYRFSEQAVRRVFLDGLEVLHLEYVLKPVRILAVARKPPL